MANVKKTLVWAKAHKVATAGIAAGVVVVLVGGGFAISAATQNRGPSAAQQQQQYNTASANWDQAQTDFEDAVAKRDAVIERAVPGRAAGLTNRTQAKAVVDAANAAKVEVKPLGIFVEVANGLFEEPFGIAEGENAYVVVTPTVPDSKPKLVKGDDADLTLFAGKLEDDIRQFTGAARNVTRETEMLEAYIFEVSDDTVADAFLSSAPNVLAYVEGAGANEAAVTLKSAIEKKSVSAQDLLDAFNAVTILQGGTPVVIPETPAANSSGNQNNGNQNGNQPAPPPAPPVLEPPAPPVVEPPAPPSVSINATEGESGNCFRVGSASSTGGSVGVPSGVTNYTKSWSGSIWNIVWYSCG